MRRPVLACTVCLLLVAALGCVHTSNLKDYTLDGKGIYFEEEIPSTRLSVVIGTTPPPDTKDDKSKKDGKKDTAAEVASAVTAVATSRAQAAAQEKLSRAVTPAVVTQAVSRGIEDTLVTYFRVQPVADRRGAYDFVVTTRLISCTLNSQPSGVSLDIDVIGQIVDRGSGAIVWAKESMESVPLRSGAAIGTTSSKDAAVVAAVSNVLQAGQLSDLSEAELRRAVEAAAGTAGTSIAETLRKDIAKARQGK